MSDLREDIHKNDFIMDKVTKQMFFVIKIDLHTVWLRDETEGCGDDPQIEQKPKHLINMSCIKVNPDVIKVLYGDKAGKVKAEDIPGETL